jgi:hypothetical protein
MPLVANAVRVIILGAPGSGMGTQDARLATQFGPAPHSMRSTEYGDTPKLMMLCAYYSIESRMRAGNWSDPYSSCRASGGVTIRSNFGHSSGGQSAAAVLLASVRHGPVLSGLVR